ncbi:amidase [Patulibacter brassicae]|jgi:amidase|uniref:Amidase n=1 Tax=Patulibacter brassicae TaxID=1705717 RepID=A0ABU4VQG0_9ACTN|nr:amidase [Patulibacter brassicae]MDX8153602.1 amidase [Patulibacter brassicae]
MTTSISTSSVTAGLREQAAALAAGTVTSQQLTEQALARIAATQPTLNAFRVVLADRARAAALDADRRLAAGERAPLLGVPVAIKDDTDLAGEETRFGCRGPVPPATADAEIVLRLKAAGAVIVGKTTTPEIGQWPITVGDDFGATRNPWNTAYSPGGSSGGSAAAVAAGVVAAAVGSDGAGSVRIPAAWTHLVGIKPQRGRISTWPDPEAFNGLTVHGPLARTVGDAALLLDVLTGNHPGELHQPPRPERPFVEATERDPGRLRVGLALNPPWVAVSRRLDPDVRVPILRLGRVLEDLGHEVLHRRMPWGPIGPLFMPYSMSGVRAWTKRFPRGHPLDHRTRENATHGAVVRPLLPVSKAGVRAYRAWMRRVFAQCDVVLTPTTATPPLPVEAIDGLSNIETDRVVAGACPYSFPWNVLGWPGVNVPAGFTGAGLPVGATLLGPENGEWGLLQLAAQLERVERWQDRWPA